MAEAIGTSERGVDLAGRGAGEQARSGAVEGGDGPKVGEDCLGRERGRPDHEVTEKKRVRVAVLRSLNLTHAEIAEAMGCPIGTVRSRIFRAREAIDEKLRPLLSDREDHA